MKRRVADRGFGVYIGFGVVALAYYAKFFRVATGGLWLNTLEFGFTARTMDWFILILGDVGLWIGTALITVLPLGLILAAAGFSPDFALPQPSEDPNMMMGLSHILIFAGILIPLALVGPFIRYRHWKFLINKMEAYGEINITTLTQSETAVSKHGEGLLDAFDIGAI